MGITVGGGLGRSRIGVGGSIGIMDELDEVPLPVFRAIGDGSIVPTIGTAGTYTRSGTFLYGASKNTLSSVSANDSPGPAHPYGALAATATLGGIYLNTDVKNYLLRASEFDNATWVKNGTASVVADSTTDPLGTSTADTLVGAAAGDGVQQDSGVAAASQSYAMTVWLKANSGSRAVDIILKDEAGTPASATTSCAVTTAWQQFRVGKTFAAGATGTIVAEIKVNDTTGYSIYAFGATLVDLSTGGQALKADWTMQPTIITGAATVTLGNALLKYAGTELQASTNIRSIAFWVYYPTPNLLRGIPTLLLTADVGSNPMQGILSSTGDTVYVTYHNYTLYDTGVLWPTNRWNHVVVAVNGQTGDNETFLNGASIHTNTDTHVAYALKNIYFAQHWDDGSGPSWNGIVGQTEYYHNVRLTLAQAKALYNAKIAQYRDLVPPSAPTNLAAVANGAHQIDLTWTASTDNVGVDHYNVYDSAGSFIDSSTTTSYSHTGLVAETNYIYKIKAADEVGNLSDFSSTANATTDATGGYPETITGASMAWRMDEASGSIVDEISSVSLGVISTPTFSVTSSGDFESISPGITYGAGKRHQIVDTPVTAGDIGATDHVVMEAYASWPNADVNTGYLFTLQGNESSPWPVGKGILSYVQSGVSFFFFVAADDGTSVNCGYDVTGQNDGNIHKWRWVWNRTTNLASLFMDGVQKGSDINMATLSGKAITCNGFRMGGQYNGAGSDWRGSIYFWRITIGSDASVLTQNIGGPGGG